MKKLPAKKPVTASKPAPIAVEHPAANLQRETIAALERVRAQLQKGWTPSINALTSQGQPCHYTHADCAKVDLYGAVMLSTRLLKFDIATKELIESRIFYALRSNCPSQNQGYSLASFNASCKDVNEVLAVVVRAIEDVAR